MSDITKCSGFLCPLKDNCYRYKAKDGVLQSYFTEQPYKDEKCKMFLGLKKITLCFFLLFLTSCGIVKKNKEQTSIEDKSTITTDITRFSDTFTLEPVDLSKPILLGKDTIYNTKVVYNNTKEIVKEKEAKNINVEQSKKEKQVDYSETIKIVANRLILAFVIVVILIVVIKKYF